MKHTQARCSRSQSARPVRSAFAGAVLLLCAADAHGQRTLDAVLRDTVLDNGLHVIVVPNPVVPLVTIQVTVRNGAFTQLSEDDVGLPHLLEHMLFRSFGSSGFGQEANKLNATYNGTTGDETVTYYVTLPAENVAKGMQLVADLMRSPRFQRDALQSEQDVVVGELERRVSDPDWLLSATVDRQLWSDAWSRKNTIGNIPAIRQATPERLRQIYERFYVPNNAAVVISGDVTATDAFALAARYFARWRAAADPFAALELPPMTPLSGHRQVTVPLEARDITLLVRWQGPSVRGDRNATYAADLFAAVLNDPVSSFQARLVDTGLFQTVRTYALTRAHTGEFSIQAITTSDQLVAASTALHNELAAFAQAGYIDAELLAFAKKRLAVEWASALATPSGLASVVGELWSVAGLDYARGYLDAVKALQEVELERFVATYLVARPRVTGIMLSPVTLHQLGGRLQQAQSIWRR